jgi:enoyl-CoA hydratase/carnithine racemase
MGGADLGTSYFLPRMIGAGVAYDLLLSGRPMLAEEAMRLGFASQCVPRAVLKETALNRAKDLATIDPSALRYTKECLNINLDLAGLENCVLVEHRNQQLIISKLMRGH